MFVCDVLGFGEPVGQVLIQNRHVGMKTLLLSVLALRVLFASPTSLTFYLLASHGEEPMTTIARLNSAGAHPGAAALFSVRRQGWLRLGPTQSELPAF